MKKNIKRISTVILATSLTMASTMNLFASTSRGTTYAGYTPCTYAIGTEFGNDDTICFASLDTSFVSDISISAHGYNAYGRFDFNGYTDQNYGLLVTEQSQMGFNYVDAYYQVWSDGDYGNFSCSINR